VDGTGFATYVGPGAPLGQRGPVRFLRYRVRSWPRYL